MITQVGRIALVIFSRSMEWKVGSWLHGYALIVIDLLRLAVTQSSHDSEGIDSAFDAPLEKSAFD